MFNKVEIQPDQVWEMGCEFCPKKDAEIERLTRIIEDMKTEWKASICIPCEVSVCDVKNKNYRYQQDIAALQAEANRNMKEPCEAKAEIDQHREKIAVLIGCRDHWKHSYDSARAEIAKMDSDIIFLGTVVEGLQAQNSALKEENTKLKEFIKTTCDPITNKIQQRHKATNLAMLSSLSVLAALPWLFRPRRRPETTQKEPDSPVDNS